MAYNINPGNFVDMIKKGNNPQQLMLYFLEQQVSATPLGQNLLSLAKQNNTQEIERIARNLLAQKGYDFDKEFNAFKQNLRL